MIVRQATLRLTLWFAIAQLALFGVVAVSIYSYATWAFDSDADIGDSGITPDVALATLGEGLLIASALLLILVPVTSFALATLALRPVRAAYEAQAQFVDDASHEFRTPLAGLISQLELALSRRRTAAEYENALRNSLSASERLQSMVDGLVAMARSQPETEARFEPVEIGRVLVVARSSFPEVEQQRIVLSVGEFGVLIVHADQSALTRAFINLLGNALRYSSGPVSVTTSVLRHRVRVVVADEGIGMTLDEQRRAFDRYWRAESSRTSPGSGLGLNVVRQIVRGHRGVVRLASELGRGTRVTVLLPLWRQQKRSSLAGVS